MTKKCILALGTLALLVLVAVSPVSATYYNVNNKITVPGATVFIGEQKLDLTNLTASDPLLKSDDAIGWWAQAASRTTMTPAVSIALSKVDMGSFDVSSADFRTGEWYGVKDGKWDGGPALFMVQDPSVALSIRDISTLSPVSGGTVARGDHLTFMILTNMYPALDPAKRSQSAAGAQTGNFDLLVKGPDGTTYTELFTGNGTGTVSLKSQNVNVRYGSGEQQAETPRRLPAQLSAGQPALSTRPDRTSTRPGFTRLPPSPGLMACMIIISMAAQHTPARRSASP